LIRIGRSETRLEAVHCQTDERGILTDTQFPVTDVLSSHDARSERIHHIRHIVGEELVAYLLLDEQVANRTEDTSSREN